MRSYNAQTVGYYSELERGSMDPLVGCRRSDPILKEIRNN